MRRWAVFVAALVVAGCGGGSGAALVVQPLAFQVTAVTPLDASEDVPRRQEINVVFSRAVDEATLSPDSLEVVAESGDVIPGDRLISPLTRNLVRFLPRIEYLPFAVHTIRVTQALHDEEGTPLDRDYEFQFRTAEEGPVLPTQSQLEDLGALLKVGRFFHRMTLLGNHRFLVTGGYLADGAPALATAENLIPMLRQSTLLAGGMRGARAGHVQLKLKDGRVLLAGGESSANPFVPLRSCEIFDPSTGVFAFLDAAPMHFPRSFAAATLLRDGRVLVTGGQSLSPGGSFIFRADAEIYDPSTDRWTIVDSRMERGRSTHVAALTSAGDVVVIGGTTGTPSATLFLSATESFSPQLGSPFFEHFFGAGTVLPDGRPFLAGGVGVRGLTLWDPQYGFLGALNQMPTERAFATATAFQDGRVVIAGGMDLSAAPPLLHDTIDIFFPIGSTGRFFPATELRLPHPTSHHAAALGPDGNLWLTGGLTVTGTAQRQTLVLSAD